MIRRVLLTALLVTAAASGFALAGKAPRTKRPAAATRFAATAPISGHIAYIGEGANLYLCEGSCDKPVCVTCAANAEQALAGGFARVALNKARQAAAAARQSELPSFSPDGTQIAYSSVRRGGIFTVSTYDLSRRVALNVFQSSDRPIYFHWLPDGRRFFFLAGGEDTLELILAQAREKIPVRILLKGLPLFFDWNQALNDLVFHYTPVEGEGPEQVALMNVTDRDQRVVKVIARGSAPFRSPAWSPDGSHLAYVSGGRAGEFVLNVANADASAPKPMVGLAPQSTSFVWAPDSKHIAFSTLKQEGKMSYDGINLLDIGSGNVTTLVSEPVIAYNFSPDGRWLAYIGTSETGNTWNVVPAGGGKARKLCRFVATSSESMVYGVFDQYALSHRIWSPDSRAIVFAGVMLKEGQTPGDTMGPPSIWVLPVDGGPPQAVGDGTIAFWSPR